MLKLGSLLFVLSLSFVCALENIPESHSRALLSHKTHHKFINAQHHIPENHEKTHQRVIEQHKKKEKQILHDKHSSGLKMKLSLQPPKPAQPKYFFDEIFSSFDSVEEFTEIFPANYFAFASQKFTANSAIINIRNQDNPGDFVEQQVQKLFQNPAIKFVGIDEINPNTFCRKLGGKYDEKTLNRKTNNLLEKLKILGENPKYQGRINLFVTNVNTRLFSNYKSYAKFIGKLLLMSQLNYLGIIYGENYIGPLSKSTASICTTDETMCLASANLKLNNYEWSTTSKISLPRALNNFRNLLKPLCPRCNINALVMPTIGLSNINGVCLNACYKSGFVCRDDLIALNKAITSIANMKNTHLAFYGAAHVQDTSTLVKQQGDYYDIESVYCEIASSAVPALNSCTESND